MIKQITYDELLLNSKIFQYHKIIKMNKFFEMLCDIIDDCEYWSINMRSPMINILENMENQHDDSIYLLLPKELKNEDIVRIIGEYFYSYILESTNYNIQIERLTHDELTEYLNIALEYQTYFNALSDYTKTIYWDETNKSIENI